MLQKSCGQLSTFLFHRFWGVRNQFLECTHGVQSPQQNRTVYPESTQTHLSVGDYGATHTALRLAR